MNNNKTVSKFLVSIFMSMSFLLSNVVSEDLNLKNLEKNKQENLQEIKMHEGEKVISNEEYQKMMQEPKLSKTLEDVIKFDAPYWTLASKFRDTWIAKITKEKEFGKVIIIDSQGMEIEEIYDMYILTTPFSNYEEGEKAIKMTRKQFLC